MLGFEVKIECSAANFQATLIKIISDCKQL